MKKTEYKKGVAKVKETIRKANLKHTEIELDYIQSNQPCKLEDKVEIILDGGRKVTGIALTFGILKDATVCITAYKKGSQTKYITTPHGKVTIL